MSRKAKYRATPFAVEPLEGRDLFSCAVAVPVAGTLNVTCDANNDNVRIYDNGNGVVSVTSFNHVAGAYVTAGPIGGIRAVNVNSGYGDDYVQYQLTGDMLFGPPSRSVNVDLSVGNDAFLFYAANDIDIPVGKYFYLNANGSYGNDNLRAHYYGELDGYLNVQLRGWVGNDFLHTDARLQTGSAGSLIARAYGEYDNDTINMLVRKQNIFDTPFISALGSGGTGVDTCNRTALAFGDATCEFINLVP
jgi:hypothetical protein